MDIEKTLQFILETQAKHEVTIQQIDERLNRVGSLVEANTGRISQLVDVCMSLATNLERLGEETARRFRETDERFREINERFRETDERFRETDYKLNALIDTVDKLVRRNGSRE